MPGLFVTQLTDGALMGAEQQVNIVSGLAPAKEFTRKLDAHKEAGWAVQQQSSKTFRVVKTYPASSPVHSKDRTFTVR